MAPSKTRRTVLAVVLGVAGSMLAVGCVTDRSASSSTTTVTFDGMAAVAFCTPMRVYADRAFLEGDDRSAVSTALIEASAAAPSELQPLVDELASLEDEGISPFTQLAESADQAAPTEAPTEGPTEAPTEVPLSAEVPPSARYHQTFMQLDLAMVGACGFSLLEPTGDVTDGSTTVTSDPIPTSTLPGSTDWRADGSLTWADVLARVRQQHPAASWLDTPVVASVGGGAEPMVEITGVDEAELALEMCEQVRSALTDDSHQPYVYLRGTDGQLVVVMDDVACRLSRSSGG